MKWVMSCEQCIRETRIDNRRTRPTLQISSRHIKGPDVFRRSEPPVPWAAPLTQRQTQSGAWLQFGGRLILLLFTLSRGFDTETRTGHLHGRNRLGQTFHLTDFNNISDPNSLLTRGFSNNRRLDTRHTKLSFRSVSSILPVNHDNIIRPLYMNYDSSIPLR